ncbi:MBL fold metallo-hydrolase [Cohnella rhizosphaerae]|uniref:MBL fold metallo-hydrolase n=1 Tax=Cohnella rhizosphaerae TaxID=1457232 RepID=A0A9X4KPD4_9BACL|nr:MBL fold metallo-hydrolase [Cohnella rhizosphaerae]MDG0808308.1 MBL fold metallo-hydrolase [Cohnella rhizosphaerae]
MLRIADGAVAVFESDLYRTTSTVVVTDKHVVVADPCWLPREVEEIRAHVEQVRGDRQVVLLFTHSDYDHIIGWGAFPGAAVVASGSFARSPDAERERNLDQIRDFDDQYYLKRNYGIAYPVVDHPMDGDGAALQLGGARLVCYQAPGHNADGMMTVVEPHGILILGDYLSDAEFPFIYEDSISYEQTLRKFDTIALRHDIKLFVPGHGSPSTGLAHMRARRDADLRYIRELRRLVAAGDEEGLARLVADAPFPRNQRKCHEENVNQIRRELADAAE